MTDDEKKTLIEATTLDALAEAVAYSRLRNLLFQAKDLARQLGREDLYERINKVVQYPDERWVSTDHVVRVVMGFDPEDYDYFNGSNHYSRALGASGAPCGFCEHNGPDHEGLYEPCKSEGCDCDECIPRERPMATLERLTGFKASE